MSHHNSVYWKNSDKKIQKTIDLKKNVGWPNNKNSSNKSHAPVFPTLIVLLMIYVSSKKILDTKIFWYCFGFNLYGSTMRTRIIERFGFNTKQNRHHNTSPLSRAVNLLKKTYHAAEIETLFSQVIYLEKRNQVQRERTQSHGIDPYTSSKILWGINKIFGKIERNEMKWNGHSAFTYMAMRSIADINQNRSVIFIRSTPICFSFLI